MTKVMSRRDEHYIFLILSLPVVFLFILSPFAALVMSSCLLMMDRKGKVVSYVLFIAIMAAFMGVICMTKTPESDTLYYQQFYEAVNRDEFWRSVILFRLGELGVKEFVFSLFSVLVNYLTHGNVVAYFFSISFVVYFFENFAIYKVFKACNRSKTEIVCAIILISVLTPYFIQVTHACRQLMATSFLMYAIACRISNHKTNWFFLLLALFTHNSTLIFIIISLIPQIYRHWNFYTLVKAILLFVAFILFYEMIGGLFSFMEIGRRLANVDNMDNEKMEFSYYAFLITGLPVVIGAYIQLKRAYQKAEISMLPLLYLVFIEIFLILALNFAPLVQARFIFYLYALYPFVIIPIFRVGSVYSKPYCILLAIFFAIRFLVVDDWVWIYKPLDETMSSSFISLLQTKL